MKKSFTDKFSVYESYEFTNTIFSDIFNLMGHTTKQLHGLKITEGLEGERMKEDAKFKNRKNRLLIAR